MRSMVKQLQIFLSFELQGFLIVIHHRGIQYSSHREKGMRTVVVGGSISGLSCAHSLLRHCKEFEFEVTILEKARFLKPAGAGLGLSLHTCQALADWNTHPSIYDITLPLSIDENRATDSNSKSYKFLARDESLNLRAAHWSDLHKLLYDNLPPNILKLGHELVSFEQNGSDGSPLTLEVRVASMEQVIKINCDLLIAADGSMSLIRKALFPHDIRRYLGYCAWRGVYDYSKDDESAKLVDSLRNIYPDLGNCLYFDLAKGTHSVLYELHGKKLNWLWYVNQPEPQLQGNSLTIQVDKVEIEKMQKAASETWVPELAALMIGTEVPFVNVLYDKDPIKNYFHGRVVLVGEAAHPTSPHGLGSTNMSIMDAYVLGRSFAKWGFGEIKRALEEYQNERLQLTSNRVLHARHLGLLKQGLLFSEPESFPWLEAESDQFNKLLQSSMPSQTY